ncbi:MAG: hypothetical protein DELT_02759 [Desulfovibrio sp.]
MNSPIAVVSDIHGNSFALKAVLDEITRRKIRRIINCGDMFYGPLDILGTYALLQSYPCEFIHIRGNGERLIMPSAVGEGDTPTIAYAKNCLTGPIENFLASLPAYYADGYVYACHGSPAADEEYLLEDMAIQGGTLKPTAHIAQSLADLPQDVILCGHSHLARTVYIPESGQLVVNPGSVGLPAYTDELPVPHTMEAGSPLAQCAIIYPRDDFWQVEQIQVPYDWQSASWLAQKNGREDWAFALATGRAP